MSVLERELKTYQRELPNLLKHEGKYVLISQDEVLGVYKSFERALKNACERLGLIPVLIKQIQAVEKPIYLRFPPARTSNAKNHTAPVEKRRGRRRSRRSQHP